MRFFVEIGDYDYKRLVELLKQAMLNKATEIANRTEEEQAEYDKNNG